MEAKELMIGDWVECVDSTHKKKVCAQIDAIEEGQNCILVRQDNCNWFLDISYLKPIELTEKILEKNDFGYCKDNGGCYGYFEESYSNQTMEIIIFNVNSEYRNCQIHISEAYHQNKTMLHLMECNYVHQLQHILKVCGIKKEICLF